jgi:CDP-diacylglycerol---glycerol-3-phosphate 3-phosphatidyltransferase
MIMNIPNFLTLLRIIMIPIFIIVFYLPFEWSYVASAMIFSFAAATDILDGYIARGWQLTSVFGEFLDPVADKLMVAVALVLLVGEKKLPFLAIPAAVIVGREIVISALREWMAEIGKRASVAVSYVGKFKTVIQMVAVVFLLAYRPGYDPMIGVAGYVLLCISAVLTLWSMTMYLKTAWPDLTFDPKKIM